MAFKAHKNLAPAQVHVMYPNMSLIKSYYMRTKQLGKRMTMRKWWIDQLTIFGINIH